VDTSTPIQFNALRCSPPKHQLSPVDSSSTNRPTPPYIDSLDDFPSLSSSSKSDVKLNQPAISTSPSSQSKLDTVHHEPANYFSENRLQRGNLTATEVFQSTINTEHTVYEKIPNGPKEKFYFLIDNSSNVMRKSYTKSSQFADNCGAWDSHSGRTVKTDFIVQSDNTLRYTCVKDNQYCFEKQVKGKKTFIPISPQPEPDSIVTLIS
jgi:hypothetical protein